MPFCSFSYGHDLITGICCYQLVEIGPTRRGGTTIIVHWDMNMSEKTDLTCFGTGELNLRVNEDDSLWKGRYSSTLMTTLDTMFNYTPEQLKVLKDDLEADIFGS